MTEKTQVDNKAKVASEQIQKILEESGLALQPFLSFSEYGVVPRVRLVDANQEANEKETDTKEAGGNETADKPADSKQS